MTADPPRLGPGEHFDLARAVLRNLEERFQFGDRLSLVNFFGIPTGEEGWLDDLLGGDQEALIQVGESQPADFRRPCTQNPMPSAISLTASWTTHLAPNRMIERCGGYAEFLRRGRH